MARFPNFGSQAIFRWSSLSRPVICLQGLEKLDQRKMKLVYENSGLKIRDFVNYFIIVPSFITTTLSAFLANSKL